jgi:adenylyltransferase/sulfurtransferase
MKIFILGAGSTGSHIANILVRNGINEITVVDRDVVEESNLGRQLYFENQIMMSKVEALRENLLNIDKDAKIRIYFSDFDRIKKEIDFTEFDVLIDCTDNIYSRMVLNDAAVKYGIPMLYTAAAGDEGRVALFIDSCFACYFDVPKERLDSCEDTNVSLSTIARVSAIAVEEMLSGNHDRLVFFNSGDIKTANIRKNPECRACAKENFEFFESDSPKTARLCGSNAVRIILNRKITDKIKSIEKNNLNFLLFPNGEAIVKGTNDENFALKELNKIVQT